MSRREGSRRGASGRKRGDVWFWRRATLGRGSGRGDPRRGRGDPGEGSGLGDSRAGRPLGARPPVGGVRGAGILGRGRHG